MNLEKNFIIFYWISILVSLVAVFFMFFVFNLPLRHINHCSGDFDMLPAEGLNFVGLMAGLYNLGESFGFFEEITKYIIDLIFLLSTLFIITNFILKIFKKIEKIYLWPIIVFFLSIALWVLHGMIFATLCIQ